MLPRGARVGRFEILELLGQGGMGEVFRAYDSQLGRDVAIKVLAERFRLDSSRLLRFEREARVLASLNHPNIAALHAIEQVGDTQALVLELVEGETLADRLLAGRLPIPEALEIARQVAHALEAAHDTGVVHRDLKPSNIKLRPDGTVKLLDFGLAKVTEGAIPGADPHAPTVTMIEAAGGDAVMGTLAYMSPEQARGLPVDKRTDIWAFGCVLYEMLTGQPAFAGEHAADVVAKIIERAPDLEALPADVPPTVRRLIRRCLEKDPRRRLRDIGDARLELEEAGASAEEAARATANRERSWLRAAALAGLVLIVTAVAVGIALRSRPAPEAARGVPQTSRFALPIAIASSAGGRAIAISADGARIAWITERGLVVRERSQLEVTQVAELAGAGAGAPFFSPDGEWIAFTDGQMLKKVPVSGGPSVDIAESGPAAIGSWSADGIVFASMHGLFRVPAEGGAPQPLRAGLEPNEQAMFPQLLPGGKAVLFTVIPTRTNTPILTASPQGARVDVLNLQSGERLTLVRGAGRAQYLRTGHLVYVSGGALRTVPFDAARLGLRGAPVVRVSPLEFSEFAVSDEGTLVYQLGQALRSRVLVWVDRQGREEPLGTPPRGYVYPRLSPDGTRVALDVMRAPDRDIWIWDLHRRTLERFTLDPAGNPIPAWSRDGRTLAFGSDRFGVTNLFRQSLDRDGEPEHLLESDRIQMPITFAPDGRLLFSVDVAGEGRNIDALALDGSRHVQHILYGPANELTADVSPDGRWIVYDSDESGQYEVYVRPYPGAYSGGRWQISSGGGRQPMWSRDGREIFYRDFDGAMYSASITLEPTFAPGPPSRLFAGAGYAGSGSLATGRTYDLSLDGRRFLMLKFEASGDQAAQPALVVVLNWFEELK